MIGALTTAWGLLTGLPGYVMAIFAPAAGGAQLFKFTGVAIAACLAVYAYGRYKGGEAERSAQLRIELERVERHKKANDDIAKKVNPEVEKFERESRRAFEEAVNDKQVLKALRKHPYFNIPLSDFGLRYSPDGKLFFDEEAARRSAEKYKAF